MGRAAPERQCVACRGKAPRDALVRLVPSPDGELVVDLKARLPGRGAWVHLQEECIARLEQRPQILTRALKAPIDVGPLRERIRGALDLALANGLSLAAAAGGLTGGREALLAALRRGEIAELVFAGDAAERTTRQFEVLAGDEVPITRLDWTAERLGGQVGKGLRAAVGVRDHPACTHLRRQLRRLRGVG